MTAVHDRNGVPLREGSWVKLYRRDDEGQMIENSVSRIARVSRAAILLRNGTHISDIAWRELDRVQCLEVVSDENEVMILMLESGADEND